MHGNRNIRERAGDTTLASPARPDSTTKGVPISHTQSFQTVHHNTVASFVEGIGLIIFTTILCGIGIYFYRRRLSEISSPEEGKSNVVGYRSVPRGEQGSNNVNIQITGVAKAEYSTSSFVSETRPPTKPVKQGSSLSIQQIITRLRSPLKRSMTLPLDLERTISHPMPFPSASIMDSERAQRLARVIEAPRNIYSTNDTTKNSEMSNLPSSPQSTSSTRPKTSRSLTQPLPTRSPGSFLMVPQPQVMFSSSASASTSISSFASLGWYDRDGRYYKSSSISSVRWSDDYSKYKSLSTATKKSSGFLMPASWSRAPWQDKSFSETTGLDDVRNSNIIVDADQELWQEPSEVPESEKSSSDFEQFEIFQNQKPQENNTQDYDSNNSLSRLHKGKARYDESWV